MSATSYSSRAYQAAAVGTADPRHLVVMLFDAAVRFLHEAREAMEKGDCEGQCSAIVRVQKILSTLMSSLNLDIAPALGGGLWQLYNYIHSRLSEASMRDDLAILGEAIELTTCLRDTWRQAEIVCRNEERQPADEAPLLAAGGSHRGGA